MATDPSQHPPGPNWGPAPTGPQGWAPPQAPPNWTPTPPPAWTPAPPARESFLRRPGSMEMLSRLAKIIGLALIVIGALLAVTGASLPGNCLQSSANCGPTGTDWPSQAAWSILVGKALATIGLGALALGAAMKMGFVLGYPTSGKREEVLFTISDRWFNGVLFLIAILLLFVLLTGIVSPAYALT